MSPTRRAQSPAIPPTRPAAPRGRSPTAVALLGAVILAGGCIARNEEIGIGVEEVTVNAIDLRDDAPRLRRDRELSSDVPAPLPLDRSDWATTRVLVPTDDILHYPTHRTDWHLSRTAREAGAYPDPLTSLQRREYTPGARLHEGGAVALGVLTDAILLPFRIIWIDPHWETTRRRSNGYARAHTQPWVAGLLSASAFEAHSSERDAELPTVLRGRPDDARQPEAAESPTEPAAAEPDRPSQSEQDQP